LSFEPEFPNAHSVFAGNGTVPFSGGFAGPLTPGTFAPLTPIAGALGAFLAETEAEGTGTVVDPATLTAGTLDVEVGTNTRWLPFRLGVGLLKRLELGAGFAVYRNERFTRRFQLD